MARDDATDISRKTGIPDRYQPRDAAGSLTSLFGSAGETTKYNLGLGFIARDGTEAAPSFMLSAAQSAARTVQITEVEKRKRDDERYAFALDQMKEALQQRLAALDAELAAIDQRLEDIRQRRELIGQQLEALDEIDRLNRAGKFDPKHNPAHARLARTAGITEEQLRSGEFATVIMQRRLSLGNEDRALEGESSGLLKRRDVVARERVGVVGALSDIENANTDEARILAERRAQTVLGVQQLGEAALRSDDQTARMIAADAVASQEAEPVRADSAVFTRNAVTNPSANVQSDNLSFVP